jgi:hypothetical protein
MLISYNKHHGISVSTSVPFAKDFLQLTFFSPDLQNLINVCIGQLMEYLSIQSSIE